MRATIFLTDFQGDILDSSFFEDITVQVVCFLFSVSGVWVPSPTSRYIGGECSLCPIFYSQLFL